VGQSSGHLDLAKKPLRSDLGGYFGTQDLERDLAIMAEIVRQIYHRHPALTEFPVEGVARGQALCETAPEVGHVGA
jgi:hypothetical protein